MPGTEEGIEHLPIAQETLDATTTVAYQAPDSVTAGPTALVCPAQEGQVAVREVLKVKTSDNVVGDHTGPHYEARAAAVPVATTNRREPAARHRQSNPLSARCLLEPASRKTSYLRDDYPAEYRADIKQVQASAGFILGLPPVPGALAAMDDMLAAGHDVRICTAPLTEFTHCVTEKYQWVQDNLPGMGSAYRAHQGQDTGERRRADHDKPQVTGCLAATWEHVVFEAPYNLGAVGRRINWDTWRRVLAEVERARTCCRRISVLVP